MGRVDSKFSGTAGEKAKNNRIGDFPEGPGDTGVPTGVEAKLGDAQKEAKVFEEDEKSAAEFLKRIN